MATIVQRGNRWQVKIRRSGHKVSKTFGSQSDAQRWAQRVEFDIEDGTFIPERAKHGELTLAEALNRYLATLSSFKRSSRQEAGFVAVISRHPVAKIRLLHLRGADMARYRDDRLLTVSQGTARRELSLISHVLEIARTEWGYQPLQNVVKDIRLPRPSRPRDRRLVGDEQEKLMAAAEQCSNPEMAVIITVAIETGMRRSELMGLTWSNVDLSNRTAHLPLTKNGSSRCVPLTSLAAQALSTLPCVDGRVFHYTAEGFAANWKRLRERVGFTDLRFHDLRHEATSRFFELGLNTMEVAAITGHKTLSMLARYTHLRAEDLVKKLP